MSQETGRALAGGSLASSLLAHLFVLALAAMLSLPASQPPESIVLDLSLLELTAEGGGSQGGGTGWARPGRAAGQPQLRPECPPTTPARRQPETPPREPQPEARQRLAAPEMASSRAETAAPSAATQGSPEAASGSAVGTLTGRGTAASGTGTSGIGTGAGGYGGGLGPGLGSGLAGLPKDYLLALHSEIERYKTYPARARRNGWEGKVRLRFVVERDGSISGVEIISSSGCSVLDEAATATLKRIERLPPLPTSIRLSRLRLELPVVYRLTR